MKSGSGGQTGTIRLMSPVFQLSTSKTSCLVIRFKALVAQLRVLLGYVNSSGRYEERLLHRNLQPMFPSDFFTLRRDVGGVTVEGQQFVLVFESKGQQLNGDLVIISEIELQGNQCNYFASDVAWNGFCDFSSTDGNSCPIADQSDLGYSWAPAFLDSSYLHVRSSNLGRIKSLRSEFDGSSRGEVSRLLTAPYTSTAEKPCLLLSATLNPIDIRLGFSLLSTNNMDPLPAPEIVQIAFQNDDEMLQLYYIHLPVGVPVMLEIKSSQSYSGSVKYSAVFLRRIEPNSCQVIQTEIAYVDSINCTQGLTMCGYQLGMDWSDSSTFSSTYLDNQWIVDYRMSMDWGSSTGYYASSTYTNMQNLAATPYIDIKKSVLMTFKIGFTEASTTRSRTSLRLDVYRTSSLGPITSKLAKYSGIRNATVELCLPAGRFHVAFLAYTNAYSVSSRIQLSELQLTETECSQPTQISYLCADDNVCLSRVMSPSPQFIWKYSSGKFMRIEGDDVLIFVYDLLGTINITDVDRVTTIYLNSPGTFSATLQLSIATDKRGCSDYSKSYVDMCVKRENGQVEDLLNSSLSTSTLWNSTDVLQIYLTSDVARCVNLLMYSIHRNGSTQGYSLQLVRNSESDLTESDNLTAQWTSDILSVADTIICLAVDLVLPSRAQAILCQESQNGTIWIRSVFISGSVTDDRIRGEFQMSLDRDASRIQIALLFNENATINKISLEFGSCHQNDASPNNNLSCDFTNFDTCGYYDASEKESRWAATASQVDPAGDGNQRECVSDYDGRSYVGSQDVTWSGRPCLPWDSQEYVVHPFDDVSYFPDSSVDSDQTGTEVLLDDVSNYCRNPSFDGTYEIWPWCYGDGARYRKEYCPIPPCQVYFMKAVFGQNLDSAVLLAPPTQFNGSACLQFQYRLSHPKIILSVQTTSLSNSLSTQTLMELNYRLQSNASDWNAANVTLNGTEDELQQVAFVAEKIGFTRELEYAAIHNIVITNLPCPETNKDQQELRELYSGNRLPTESFKQLVLDDNSHYNMGDIATMIGHQQDRLIYRCEWNGAKCSETDIRSELTDMGLCYTFNGDVDHLLSSNNTGSKYGLHLLLNVEEYDNAPIYNENNGIKIHLRNYDNIPQVKDSGFTVAPGYQTLAPLDYLTVENLVPPWGRCSSKKYEFFNSTDRYTLAKCRLECQTKSVMAACGCKDVFMPGPGEICPLDVSLSCVDSWKDQGLCSNVCPDQCTVFSYATALSFSQVSGSGIANILWNTDSIRETYWHSLEVAHRVDDAELMRTVSALESVIVSHRQLKDLIYGNILNPATSVTTLILRAVGKLMEIVGNDVDSTQPFLDSYQDCYKRNGAFLVQHILGQLTYASQQLADWQNSFIQDDQYTDLKNLLGQIKTTISSANDSLSNLAKSPFCPANLFEKSCSSFIHSLDEKIEAILSLIQTEKSGSDIHRQIDSYLSDAQLSISQILTCMAQYANVLNTFKSILDSGDQTVASVDVAVATRTMNTLLTDGSWLETLMAAYLNGSRTKRWLSDGFLRESNNRLLLNVGSALSGLESSVLSDVTSIISAIETRTISVYSQLVMYLYKLQTFMPVDDTGVNGFSRKLLMWRSPSPMLQDKTLAGYQLTSDQIEQSLGVDVTLADLANRSATLVPIIVHAYTTSLKQTLSNVQSELRSAQQVVVNSVDALSQQLIVFNDSTIIGDSFVRNNLVEIEIFYGELKYRTIKQTTGYDIVQFLSDFGGCFGLFLGGSILSVFEFLDLLIYNLFVKMSTRKRTKLSTRVNVRPTPGVQGLRPRSGLKIHPMSGGDLDLPVRFSSD